MQQKNNIGRRVPPNRRVEQNARQQQPSAYAAQGELLGRINSYERDSFLAQGKRLTGLPKKKQN